MFATRMVCAVALVAMLAGCSDAGTGGGDAASREAATVTYLTGAGIPGREAFVYVGIEKGYFRDAGLDVEVKPGTGTVQNLQLLSAGQADFVVVDIPAALIEYGKGTFKDFTVVSGLQQRNLACVIALSGGGIAGPKDLAGKKVAYIPGGVVKTLFNAYASRAGLDPASVRWVNMPIQQMGQNLAAGTIDAATQFVVGAPAIEAAAKGRKAVVMPFSDHLPDLYGNGLAVSGAAVRERPDRVRAFTGAMLKALTYTLDHPDEAAKIYTKYQKTQPEPVAAAELRLMAPYTRSAGGVPVGGLDRERLARTAAIIRDAGVVTTEVRPDDVVSYEFAPKS